MTTFTDAELDALIAALQTQKQLDADGCMVAVSRQACDEAADAITYLRQRDPIGAVIMRERAVEVCMESWPDDDVYPDPTQHRIRDIERATVECCQDDIRALPIPTNAEILAYALELPEVRAMVRRAILDAQITALETGRIFTPDEIEAETLAALEPK